MKSADPLGSRSTVLRAMCIVSASSTFECRATVLGSRVYSLYWFDASNTLGCGGSVSRARACIKGTCLIAQPYHQLLRALKGTNHEIYLKIYETDAQFFSMASFQMIALPSPGKMTPPVWLSQRGLSTKKTRLVPPFGRVLRVTSLFH